MTPKSHNYQPRRRRRCKQPKTLRTWPAALFVLVAQVLRMAGGGSVASGLKAYLHCVGAQRRDSKFEKSQIQNKTLYDELKRTSTETLEKTKKDAAVAMQGKQRESEAAKALADDKLASAKKELADAGVVNQKKLEEAQASQSKAEDAMAVIGGDLSMAAAKLPDLLSAAEVSLDEQVTKINQMASEMQEVNNMRNTYKPFFDAEDETSAKLKTLMNQFQTLAAEKEDQALLINDLEAQKNSLEFELKTATDTATAANEEAAATRTKIGEFSIDSTSKIELLQVDNDDQASQLTALNMEIDDLKNMIQQHSDDYVEEITAAREEMSAQIATEKSQRAAAEAEIKKVNVMKDELKARLDKEVAGCNSQIKQLNTVIVEEQANGKSLTDKLAASVALVAKRDGEIDDGKVALEAMKVENLSVKTSIKEATDVLANEKVALNAEINRLKNEIESNVQDIARRTNELATATTAVNTVRAALNNKTQVLNAPCIAASCVVLFVVCKW